MSRLLRYLWFVCIIRPLVLLGMGVNIRNRERLSVPSPAIVVANHNSHLDTMVLMSLFPMARLRKIHPVAAEDYFLRTKWLAWFALNIVGIIPLNRYRKSNKQDPLAGGAEAIERGDILLLFPEGSRGEPERLSTFKNGIAHLAKRYPEVPVIPVFMQGLGKALPRGEWLLVPVICDVVVGEPMYCSTSRQEFMDRLEEHMKELASQVFRTLLE